MCLNRTCGFRSQDLPRDAQLIRPTHLVQHRYGGFAIIKSHRPAWLHHGEKSQYYSPTKNLGFYVLATSMVIYGRGYCTQMNQFHIHSTQEGIFTQVYCLKRKDNKSPHFAYSIVNTNNLLNWYLSLPSHIAWTDWLSARIMWLNGISGHDADGLISQLGNSINSPSVHCHKLIPVLLWS